MYNVSRTLRALHNGFRALGKVRILDCFDQHFAAIKRARHFNRSTIVLSQLSVCLHGVLGRATVVHTLHRDLIEQLHRDAIDALVTFI